MKITSSDEISKYINQTAATGTKKPADKTHKPAGVHPESQEDVTVNLSQRSKEVLKAQEVIQSLPDVRPEKVQAIKKKIDNGTYEIDHDKTAERMLNLFLDEISRA